MTASNWRELLAQVPEPPELVAQSEALAAQRERDDERCADCGEKRSAHGWGSSEFKSGCRFVERPVCPNIEHDFLCTVIGGVFVPECGCPIHDPDEVKRRGKATTLHVHNDIEQRSPEWFDLRRGMVTASNVGKLVTVRKLGALDFACPACGAEANGPCLSKRGAEPAPIKTLHPERTPSAANKTQVLEPASNDESRGLTALLAAERITGFTEPTFMTDAMWQGVEDEPRAVDKYSERYAPVTTCGFIVREELNWTLGYSPVGLVGDDGLVEVKSRRPKKHLMTILSDSVPSENVAQIQAGLLVTGRDWCEYISYCGGMPMYVKRVFPDRRWFDAITAAVRAFEANAREMQALYADATQGLVMTERVTELEMRIA